MTPPEARAFQRALNARARARGIRPVAVDGIVGPQTEKTARRVGYVMGVRGDKLRAEPLHRRLVRVVQHPNLRTPRELARARRRALSNPDSGDAVIGRDVWGARPPSAAYSSVGTLKRAVVHHTAFPSLSITSPVAERLHMRVIQGWHRVRGFIDIGYHRVTFRSGRTYEGRPLTALGAGVAGWNTGSIHYCIAGNYEVETPTPASLSAVGSVMRQDGTAKLARFGHYQLQANACPGRNVKPHVQRL